jgi:hypothetical protein
MIRRYTASIAINKRLLNRALKGEYPIYTGHLGLAVNYMSLGQEKKGRAHAAEVLRVNPGYPLEAIRSRHPFKNPGDLKRLLDPLREAGIT